MPCFKFFIFHKKSLMQLKL